MEPPSPNPPSADDFLQLIRRQHRGNLQLYLGAFPGVGKTYRMLADGNRLKNCGVDVVVGCVDAHQRTETAAQIGHLEIIPPRLVQYQGITLKELDVDAVLARNPAVALVDELAQMNAPGSKHRKRFEQVNDLLNAGINVISTVNIEHLESLQKIVEKAIGVRVQQHVPDDVVMNADRLVDLDLPYAEMLGRLQSGKIYPLEGVHPAMENFFTEENLTLLREMSLGVTAKYLARKQREASMCGNGQRLLGKVAVALSSHCPDPGLLLRETTRLAAQFNPPWRAVYVRTPHEAPTKIDAELQRRITDTLDLAQKMGGVAVVVKHEDVAQGLISIAREHGITHMVLGRPARRHVYRWFSRSLIEMLTRELANVEIVIV